MYNSPGAQGLELPESLMLVVALLCRNTTILADEADIAKDVFLQMSENDLVWSRHLSDTRGYRGDL